jgi:hypothetical protein
VNLYYRSGHCPVCDNVGSHNAMSAYTLRRDMRRVCYPSQRTSAQEALHLIWQALHPRQLVYEVPNAPQTPSSEIPESRVPDVQAVEAPTGWKAPSGGW